MKNSSFFNKKSSSTDKDNILSIFIKDKPKTEIEEGMSVDEITEIISNHMGNFIRTQLERGKHPNVALPSNK